MSSLNIGLTGLAVAQQALDVIGSNIANASTEGYHRQDPVTTPLVNNTVGGTSIGGAKIELVKRNLDVLLENQILRQKPQLGQLSQELTALQTVQIALGDMDGSGVLSSIGAFFNSLTQLAAQPDSQALRDQTVWMADGMCKEFSNVDQALTGLDGSIMVQAQDLMTQVNDLSGKIAQLNQEIITQKAAGLAPNILMDQRDQAVAELSNIADVQVTDRGCQEGGVNIQAWGTPLVVGSTAMKMQVGLTADNKLGVTAAGAGVWDTSSSAGQLGGLMGLKNDILAGIRDNVDALASTIISQINQFHVQGIGSSGSYTELDGASKPSGTLAGWDHDIKAGVVYTRTINQATGAVSRQSVAIDPAADTLAGAATKLDNLTGVSARVLGGALVINADAGYKFDFLPAVAPTPYAQSLTGSSAATLGGLYTGPDNQVFTLKVVGSGDVGVSQDLSLQVIDGAGGLLRTVNIGLGYPTGQSLDIGDGMTVTLSPGDIADGDTIQVQALANSDTSGFLAAAGINNFLTGSSTRDIAVRPDLLDDSSQLATGLTGQAGDNRNILRMAALSDTAMDDLGGKAPSDFYRLIMTNVGQRINTDSSRQDALQTVMQQLTNQRDKISGVDINDEAAKMLLFQQMFQAMAKYLSTQNTAMASLMEIL